jgi:hypothetical protein
MLPKDSPHHEPMTAIYQTLKDFGFRETYWQFVYPGQIGGLIKSPRNQPLEFHVRFFEGGMIYAEFELGRSVLLHFSGHRYYLNRYIVGKTRSRLSPGHSRYLEDAVAAYKSVHNRNWLEWGSKNRFMTTKVKRQLRFLTLLSDWRILAMLMLASVFASINQGPRVVPLFIAFMIGIYLLAPKRS